MAQPFGEPENSNSLEQETRSDRPAAARTGMWLRLGSGNVRPDSLYLQLPKACFPSFSISACHALITGRAQATSRRRARRFRIGPTIRRPGVDAAAAPRTSACAAGEPRGETAVPFPLGDTDRYRSKSRSGLTSAVRWVSAGARRSESVRGSGKRVKRCRRRSIESSSGARAWNSMPRAAAWTRTSVDPAFPGSRLTSKRETRSRPKVMTPRWVRPDETGRSRAQQCAFSPAPKTSCRRPRITEILLARKSGNSGPRKIGRPRQPTCGTSSSQDPCLAPVSGDRVHTPKPPVPVLTKPRTAPSAEAPPQMPRLAPAPFARPRPAQLPLIPA